MRSFTFSLFLIATLFAAGLWTPAAGAADMIRNPAYQQWAGFKPGSSVKLRQVSENEGVKTEMLLTSTLVALTPQKAVVETKAELLGGERPETMEPSRIEHPLWIEDPFGPVVDPEGIRLPKPKEGTEDVTLNGKTYKCKTAEYSLRVDRDVVWNKTWTSDQVPGGVVKNENRVRGVQTSTTTMTLVEFVAK